jgi:hypothetical protein
MRPKQRYYSDDDPEFGVTPSQFKRLSRAKKREYMIYWFGRNFEDPAQETPYNSQEGGYLYIWGGPYDAREELADEFAELVPEDLIEEVAEEVESDGVVDWAPGPNHPDHQRARAEYDLERERDQDEEPEPDLSQIIQRLEAGARPKYGDGYERQLRQELLDQLDEMRRALVRAKPTHGGIGHNKPPPDDDVSQVPNAEEVHDAAELIKNELVKPEPDALAVARATSALKSSLLWLGKKINIAVDNFAKEFGGAAGKLAGKAVVTAAVAGATYVTSLGGLIADVVRASARWLHYVTLPF